MTYTEAINSDKIFRLRDIELKDVVSDAIRHANWFSETNNALIGLANEWNSREIRKWADEISADAGADWGQEFADQVASNWRSVSEAIDALASEEEAWAREFYASRNDEDELDEDELNRAFRGIYRRMPDSHDRRAGLWSLICAGSTV